MFPKAGRGLLVLVYFSLQEAPLLDWGEPPSFREERMSGKSLFMVQKRKKTRKVPLSKALASLVLASLSFGIGYQVRESMIRPAPVKVADYNVNVRFSPRGGCTHLVVAHIGQAKHYINGAIYCFNSAPIANALLAAHKRGVTVRIFADGRQSKREWEQLTRLRKAGIPVRIARIGVMHNKVMLIDGLYVLTGSFNWTKPGESKNAENLLCIKSPMLCAHYTKEWEKYWVKAKPYKGIR